MLSEYTTLADFCEAAGEPMRASYKVKELARLLGLDAHMLYGEIRGGRLEAYVPRGCTKGTRVLARSADTWLVEEW